MAPALSGALILILVGYFATAVLAVSTSDPGQESGNTIVYIVETPVSWQYSPENVTVVIGVKSTVTWVSNSISYDTVTDKAGSFRPGPIAPGQTFTYSFTQPGVYSYSCIYHPWMTGTVTSVTRRA